MDGISKYRGHEIHCVDDVWFYSDTNELVESTYKNRPCAECNCFPTAEGHDNCLGTLPDVMNACCGHGALDEAYVQLMDGSCLRGALATEYIAILTCSKAESLAKRFHNTYERLSTTYGYETRISSRVDWDKVPEKNKRLMIATCEELLKEGIYT